LFDSQLRDGGIDHFASDADDLDPVIGSEFLTDRGLSQIGLPVHKAYGRISGLHRRSIAEAALSRVQSRRSGVIAIEQIRTRAASIASFAKY
jgi:hypothetical protein